MPSPLPSIDFYAHHSPLGAFSSFTLGRIGHKGGFGLELSGPAKQDVYIALSRPGEGVRALPFYSGAQSGGAEAYTGTASAADAPAWRAYDAAEITRTMGWASDTWRAGDLTFRLLTPFGPMPDPDTLSDDELRFHLCPALLAEVRVDNRASEKEAHAFFGVAAEDPLRPLSDATGGRMTGIASETRWGFALVPDGNEARETITWGVQEAVARASSQTEPPLHRLGNRGGLLLRVAPGEERTFTLALGFYRGGVVTSGLPASYLYTRLFADLEEVLAYAAAHAVEYRERALERDAELDAAPLSDERRFLLAHATHSYHGSTELLNDERGAVLPDAEEGHRPLWVVNEGEYRMLNTFDLTVDHAFFECRFHPWTLRNTLDLFVERYSYTDEVQDATAPERPRFPGGISFTHDMGVANQFTRPGYSSYERSNLDGCFSYMTMEQLCNWSLCAALYAFAGEGDTGWLCARKETLDACLESLLRRDGAEGARDGILSLDSSRCEVGQEITTYDSLDASLGQARANGYLCVKAWAACLALARCLRAAGDEPRAAVAEEQAARIAAAVAARWDGDSASFPAVFEPGNPGNDSRIIPAIEGLAYPFVLNDTAAVSEAGPYGELISLLKRHLASVLKPGVCIDPVSGGWKMSSTSQNTWMSKIFLSQFVAEKVLGVAPMPECDAAHARWQRDGGCRDYAFVDQVNSPDGKDLGSRYYPRGVTAILWL